MPILHVIKVMLNGAGRNEASLVGAKGEILSYAQNDRYVT